MELNQKQRTHLFAKKEKEEEDRGCRSEERGCSGGGRGRRPGPQEQSLGCAECFALCLMLSQEA